MKKIFKTTALAAMLAAASIASPTAYAAGSTDAAEMPVILTLKTNVFGYQGPDNNFTIYLGALNQDTEFYVETAKTSEYVWVDPWTIGTGSDGEHSAIATAIPCSVSETDNTVIIRGDASQLDYIDVHGCYLNSIEFNGDFPNLMVVDLSHNELTAIDLEKLESLQSIDLTDNQITRGSNMKIGANHPHLYILQIGINDDVDPNLDLRNYPELAYFSCRNNYGVTHVDPTGCPNLISLVLEVTNITSLDVSKNPKLDVLNISNTRVTDIDLSHNPVLGEFYASHEGSYNNGTPYKLTSIDVSKNPKLQYLDLSGNRLTELDLSNNHDLILLYLQKNQLSELDLSGCTRLASVNLSNNLFTFATLPIPQYGWDYVYYRSPLPCYFKYRVGEEIDFASSVIRAPYVDAQGNTITPVTDARVFTTSRLGTPEMIDPDSDIYTYADGKIVFHQALQDSVFIRFYNSIFNDWDLDTQSFMIKTDEDYDAPATAFTFTPYSSMNGSQISFKMGVVPVASGVSYPAEVTISVAGESIGTFGVNRSRLPEENNITFNMPATGGTVDVFVTDGFGLAALEMDGVKMSKIELDEAEDMDSLAIRNANLASISLKYNRALRSLDLSGNLFSTIDLTPVRGDFEKWNLTRIILANNHLTSINTDNSQHYRVLDLSNNWFSNFDFKYYSGITSLDVSNNRFSGELNLENLNRLENLNISGNNISSLVAPLGNIGNLDVRDNALSFATLPLFTNASNINYAYAPQKKMQILAGGASINLSAQNVGSGTTYTWKYSSNGEIVPAELYTLESGVTRFSEQLVGSSLFCEMVNASFPDFNNQPLTTTDIRVMDKPTNVVAKFTPVASGPVTIGFAFANSGANAVYIDWNGDGSQYDEYLYDSEHTAIYRDGMAIGGKTATVYTYGDPAAVTALFMNNPGELAGMQYCQLLDLDVTPMVNATAFDIHNAGLTDGSVRLPASNRLFELVFDGNKFENQVFTDVNGNRLPALSNLVLANNQYKTFDISNYPNVQFLQISDNQIAEIKMPQTNNRLYQLNATNNQLTSIDLSSLHALQELILSDNDLTTLDVSPVKDKLHALLIAGNRFTFATLPKLTDFNIDVFTKYDYFSQKPMVVECVEGKVDLSDQLLVPSYTLNDAGDGYVEKTFETTYRWFLGDKQSDVYYDYYYEMFMGEELEGPSVSDDPEYTIEGGVTTFRYSQNRKVIGAMTNDGLSGLILYTTPFVVKVTGVEDVAVDNADNKPVDVYNLAGVRIRTNVLPGEALEGLAPGLYIVGDRKVYVK